jgi:hypothetical protein
MCVFRSAQAPAHAAEQSPVRADKGMKPQIVAWAANYGQRMGFLCGFFNASTRNFLLGSF